MSDLSFDIQVRAIALEWAVRLSTDLEQPRSAKGYTEGNCYRNLPTNEAVIDRAKVFETFLNGK